MTFCAVPVIEGDCGGFVVTAKKNNSRRMQYLEGIQQEQHLQLMRPSVDKVSVEDVGYHIHVTSTSSNGKPVTAKQSQKVLQLAMNVSEDLNGRANVDDSLFFSQQRFNDTAYGEK
jgi:hypothetical protein